MIRGVVQVLTDGRPQPLPAATVTVNAAEPSVRLGIARTNDKGAFSVTIDSATRVSLIVSKQGHYSVGAKNPNDTRLVLDCSRADDCQSVQLQMRRASVITGNVVDQFGDPIQDVEVSANRFSDIPGGEPLTQGVSGSDDRGRLRIAGLRPGRYRLDTRSFWLFYDPGRSQLTGEPIEIGAGEQVEGLQIVLSTDPAQALPKSYEVSGTVEGVDVSQPGVHFINIRGLSRGRRGGMSNGRSLGAGGAFSFSRVPAGRYLFTYGRRANPYEQSDQRIVLAAIEVSGDLTGLTLRPSPPTGVRGRVRFEPPLRPTEVSFALYSDELGGRNMSRATPPALEFAIEDLLPGVYTVRFHSWPREFFLRGVRRADRLDSSREIRVVEGSVHEIELVLSADFATVRGNVRRPREEQGATIQPAAQFWVAVKGPEGVRSAQTDQHGGFVLEKLVPGSYRIAAWARGSWQSLRNDETWRVAGEAVRAFELDPGSDASIDLTAVP